MQVDGLAPLYPPSLKRSRSNSPSSNKRRVPPTYAPSIYAQLPPHLVQSLALPFAPSGSSSPDSWVTRTSDLQLATPPTGSPQELQGAWDWGAQPVEPAYHSQHEDSMDADDTYTTSQYPPPPCPPSSPHATHLPYPHHLSALSHPSHSHPSLPPHQPPSLFANLAGSPHMSHSSSSASSTDMEVEPRGPEQVPYSASPQRRAAATRVTMGYRADCEKCVARVPGHYSHIATEGRGW